MKKGTQEMLDAAKDDATLLPFDTVFVTRNIEASGMPKGVKVVRAEDENHSTGCVCFVESDGHDFWFCSASDLKPAKKSKPKKWQNGTQAQLDAARDDARLIPKKTYFRSTKCEMRGMVCYRADYHLNDRDSVLMVEFDDSHSESSCHAFCHIAAELDPIND